MRYGYSYAFEEMLPRLDISNPFNPVNVDNLGLYMNKKLGVNTKLASDFDGVNEYLSSAGTDFNFGNESFSLGCCFKLDSSSSQAVLGKWGNSSNNKSFVVSLGSLNDIKFLMSSDGSNNDTVLSSAVTAALGTWVFVAAVYDSAHNLAKISVNANDFDVEPNSLGAFLSSASPLEIGRFESGGYLDGAVDGTFFYNKALSLAEIQALYASNNGLAYANLPSVTGDEYAIGKKFNGTTDAYNIDSALTSLAATTEGKIEFDYKPTATTPSSPEYLMTFGETTGLNYIAVLHRNTGRCRLLVVIGGTVSVALETDSQVFTGGVWANIKIIQDGTPKIYIDNVLVAQTESGSSASDWFNDVPLIDNGRISTININSSGNTNFVDGSIDTVRIYDDAAGTSLVASYDLNQPEGAVQTDTVNGYNAIPIGVPVSTLGDGNDTTIGNMETDLITWLEHNETSGTRYDEKGNNDFTDNNSVGYTLGKIQEPAVSFPKGTLFNGSSDAYNMDSALAPLASTTTGIIEFDVKLNTTGKLQRMIVFGNTNTDTYIAVDCKLNQTVGFLIKTNAVTDFQIVTDSPVLSASAWVNVKVVQDGVPKIYINDFLVPQTTISSSNLTHWFNDLPTLDNGRIACQQVNNISNSVFTDGIIQNVKIWADDTQTTLVADYILNSLEDTSGNGHNLTAIGAPTFTEGRRPQELVSQFIDQSPNMFVLSQDTVVDMSLLTANAIDFDGVTDSLSALIANAFSSDQSGFVFFSGYSTGNTQRIFGSSDTSSINDWFGISVFNDKIGVSAVIGGVSNFIQSTDTLPIGDYFWAAIKSDGSVYTFWINGIQVSKTVVTGTDSGQWFADVAGRDNLEIGVARSFNPLYGDNKSNKLVYISGTPTQPVIDNMNTFMSDPNN